MSVTVRYSETYDLSTKVDQMGMIGIHTPPLDNLRKLYSGLFVNFKFYRIDHCDVALACASVLPADPLQVGTESGTVAPQDMFNPILYKAVSNESFSTLQSRLYSLGDLDEYSSIAKADQAFSSYGSDHDAFTLYYSLLSQENGFKKVMPQQGLSMKGLYPMVYEMLSNYGNQVIPSSDPSAQTVPVTAEDGTTSTESSLHPMYFRGKSTRMPRFSTKATSNTVYPYASPTTYVACIITPPAKQHVLYYRMRITWTVVFEELCTVQERSTVVNAGVVAKYTYHSDYDTQSASMTSKSSTVDTKGTDLELIMTAGQ